MVVDAADPYNEMRLKVSVPASSGASGLAWPLVRVRGATPPERLDGLGSVEGRGSGKPLWAVTRPRVTPVTFRHVLRIQAPVCADDQELIRNTGTLTRFESGSGESKYSGTISVPASKYAMRQTRPARRHSAGRDTRRCANANVAAARWRAVRRFSVWGIRDAHADRAGPLVWP